MHVMIRLLAALFFCLLLSQPMQAQPYPEELIDRAMEAVRARDYDKAIEILKPEADKGDVWAGFFLALTYEERGEPGDFETSVQWYRKGAAAGHPKSQALLGDMLRWGKGVEADPKEAETWYRAALNEHVKEAERGLAILMAKGQLAEPVNWNEVAGYFLTAASFGDVQSMNWLNSMVLIPQKSGKYTPGERFLPALCYLATIHTRLLVESDEDLSQGESFVINWRAPAGCILNWTWSDKDHRWMTENLMPWLQMARRELVSEGFTTLPKQLDIAITGNGDDCLATRQGKTKPRLKQDGPDLTITGLAGADAKGAIVDNHIVFGTSVSLQEEFPETEASMLVVYGDWNGQEARLTNTMQSCTVTFKPNKSK